MITVVVPLRHFIVDCWKIAAWICMGMPGGTLEAMHYLYAIPRWEAPVTFAVHGDWTGRLYLLLCILFWR
jgi:hypothetical protein